MRTAINVVLILLVALGAGFALRSMQPPSDPTSRTTSERASEGAEEGIEDSGVLRPVAKAASLRDSSTAAEPTPVTEGESPDEETWLTRFTLTERSGEEISSEDLKGEPYVVSFFFSTCPSICVMQNQKIQQLQTEFKGQGVRFVAISVDPETDTPEQLREYAKRYKADEEQWLFLTGDLTYIRRVGAEIYSVAADEKFHTEKLILVDSAGEIAGWYTWTEDRQFDQLKKDIRQMIRRGDGVG